LVSHSLEICIQNLVVLLVDRCVIFITLTA
jgi:hypothetical protein